MNFPVFHLDYFSNPMLIAIIAVTHVIINHAMAVGAIPLIALFEWYGHLKGDENIDKLAYKYLLVCFIITTSLGALTGVGIWFSASLVNPYAIGSLIRVFFWAWFTEWLVFITEVCLILLYYFTWKRWRGKHKAQHIKLGVFLAIFSWITMAIIVGILGYMMQSGTWIHNESFWGAFFNPLYLPQLAFRTFFALMLAGVFFMFLTPFFTKAGSYLRRWAIQVLGFWTLFWWFWAALSAFNYWYKVPELMKSNTPVAIATQQFTTWYDVILIMLLAAVVTVLVVALWGVIWPRRMPAVVAIIPFCLAIVLVGYFERVREFIRKPYVIEEYLYSNGLRVQDYPLFKEQGILPYSTYVANSIITPENEIDAGRDVFMVSCTRCHTASGANSITRRFSLLYGEEPWDKSNVASFISGMHNVRYFMPPFPGNDAELQALAAYIVKLQQKPERLYGAQEVGVSINSSN